MKVDTDENRSLEQKKSADFAIDRQLHPRKNKENVKNINNKNINNKNVTQWTQLNCIQNMDPAFLQTFFVFFKRKCDCIEHQNLFLQGVSPLS